MKLSTRAIIVLRTALSYTMMVWSRMSMAKSSATSMTNSESTIRAFATLRFVGDALDPDEISDVVKERPTKAHRKGEIYRPSPRSPEVTGKTGIWYFSGHGDADVGEHSCSVGCAETPAAAVAIASPATTPAGCRWRLIFNLPP